MSITIYPIIRSPYTGRLSAGFRFRLNIRSISHKSLYLPLEMKELSQIKLLMQGTSPLEVFNCQSLQSARKAFNDFRKQFDFPFWAATEYHVRDIEDPDRIVPLCLNRFQHRIADTFLKRYFNRELGRYVITKTFGRIGVSTCVQAYILWRQTYYFPKHSYTCSASDISINPLKTNLCRYLHRDIVPSEKYLFLPKVGRRAFFNTYHSPDYIRGIDLGFAHFADMSRWHDPDDDYASRAYSAASSSVLLKHYTLVVLEGNIPKPDRFQMKEHQKLYLPRHIRLSNLSNLSNNPFFLDQVVLANIPKCIPHLHPINL
ncbi:MAG: hypothetical protein K2I08_10415 [Muribaculaceae bacterium]|nr:hypothetical protein [Muribaculaceae bacterium]